MDAEPGENPLKYSAYILRVWGEGETGVWRASLQNAVTGKKWYFATLERLCLFLLEIDGKP